MNKWNGASTIILNKIIAFLMQANIHSYSLPSRLLTQPSLSTDQGIYPLKSSATKNFTSIIKNFSTRVQTFKLNLGGLGTKRSLQFWPKGFKTEQRAIELLKKSLLFSLQRFSLKWIISPLYLSSLKTSKHFYRNPHLESLLESSEVLSDNLYVERRSFGKYHQAINYSELHKNQELARKLLYSACEDQDLDMLQGILSERIININDKDENGETILHRVAKKGFTPVAECLIKGGAEVNEKSFCNNTPLHLAAENNCEKMVALLLDHQSDPFVKNREGNTPLHLAAENNCEKTAALLLGHQSEPLAKNREGNTPLHLAAANGHEVIVKLLVDNKTGFTDPNYGSYVVNEKNYVGNTPLHLATENNHEAVVRLLIAENKPNLRLKNYQNRPPLIIAVDRGNDSIVRDLLRYYTKSLVIKEDEAEAIKQEEVEVLLLALQKRQAKIFRLFLEDTLFSNRNSRVVQEGLFSAAQLGDFKTIIFFKDCGVSLEEKNSVGQTIVHIASFHNKIEVLQGLYEIDKELFSIKDERGATVLHWASTNFSLKSIAFLTGEDFQGSESMVNVKDAFEQTPLHWVVKKGKITNALMPRVICAAVLLKLAGADAAVKDRRDRTILEIAENRKWSDNADFDQLAAAQWQDLIKIISCQENATLLEVIRDLQKNGSQTSLLVLAILEENIPFTKFLIDQCRAPLNFGYEKDNSPLHYAAQIGNIKIIKILLDAGAQIQHLNDRNKTPLDLAISQEDFPCIDLLASFYDVKKNLGHTLLHLAAIEHKPALIDLLIKDFKGSKAERTDYLNKKTTKQWTALHYAAQDGQVEVARSLLKAGADVHARTGFATGMTPLHIAILSKQLAFVKFLVTGFDCNGVWAGSWARANVNFKGLFLSSPLAYALRDQKNCPEIVEFLKQHNATLGWAESLFI